MVVSNQSLMKLPLFTRLLFIHLITIHAALASGQCQRYQQHLLLQLSNSLIFNREGSKKLSGWNESIDCCQWNGVSCNDIGHVTGLDLSDESISGGIENASGLFSLQYLQSLNLSSSLLQSNLNNFNTTVPTSLGNLKELLYLNLSNAGFVGQIPIEISNMTKLVSLDLSCLYFPGPSSLKLQKPNLAKLVQNLTRLQELYLDGVNISTDGNKWSQGLSLSLTNLQVLSLCNCFLSGPIHPSFTKLQSLSNIRLSYNKFSAPFPEFLANFSMLNALHLRSCELYGTFPKSLFQVPTLEILDLSCNEFLQGTLPEFHQILPLQALVLSSTKFSGTLPESIGNLGNLSRIELADCYFSGPIPSSMITLTQLVYLDFSVNSFTGPLPSLRNSKKLTHLDFSNNKLSGEIPSTHLEGLLDLVYVNLKNNSLSGSIPPSLFTISSLQKILLSHNKFGGHVPEFPSAPSSSLETLDLSNNKLEGSLPQSIFDLKGLSVLSLSSNKFNSTVQLDWFSKLRSLTELELSDSNLTVDASPSNSTSSSFPKFSALKLASCNLKIFPNLRNQSNLIRLDLSDNKISGAVPHWIWEIGNELPLNLNLSRNLLIDLEQPYSFPSLSVLDLHDNQLQGKMPPLPPFATYVDYSRNKFTSFMPEDIGTNLNFTVFLSLSENNLRGAVPDSICNGWFLQVVDLSYNSLGGTIPSCLIQMSKALRVLNLRSNNFTGNIPDEFEGSCELRTLDLSGNLLGGNVPRSLAHCRMLEFLDLGKNQIKDTFPCHLKKISSLHVLVLQNNRFFGGIGCPDIRVTWPRLHIIDLASNNFNGSLPQSCFTDLDAMMRNVTDVLDHLKFSPLWLSELYYQDSMTVTSKGLKMELVKIPTVFTSIDFSFNNFEGSIPEVLGQLQGLYVLNLSHNALSGSIPSSVGNLSQLESLDLSDNNLNGSIPQQLAQLTFLSFLNLSYNRLVGRIPKSTQLQSFTSASFEGNEALCGLPLEASCGVDEPPSREDIDLDSGEGFDKTIFIIAEVGFVFGLAIIICPITYWKRYRIWYWKQIDYVIFRIFPRLGERNRNPRRRAHGNHGGQQQQN